MELLPENHKAKWFAGATLTTAAETMASVKSTQLSRLNAFLDIELEQLLCFDTEIDAEKFCSEKSAIFIVMPEEDPGKFFMVSLIIQQLYREILAVADENGGKLENRCVFYCDEFGTLPKIESAEMMFFASRSRRLQIVPIIQSFAQLEKNYGKEGADVIIDNTQLTIFGGFAPNSTSADTLSKALGSRTVMSSSVSRSKDNPSQSVQMIERPLMSSDELNNLPKGTLVVMKTAEHPIKVKMKLFFKWGNSFEASYSVEEHSNCEVHYAAKKELIDAIIANYCPDLLLPAKDKKDDSKSGGVKVARANKDVSFEQASHPAENKELEKPAANKKSDKKDDSISGNGNKLVIELQRLQKPHTRPMQPRTHRNGGERK